MKSILELYNELKQIKGVDLAVIDAYIKVVIRDSGCESISDLLELISNKEAVFSDINSRMSEINKECAKVNAEQKDNFTKHYELETATDRKCMLILLSIFGVIGLSTAAIVIFMNIPTFLIGLLAVVASGKIGMQVKEKIMQSFYESKKVWDQLDEKQVELSAEFFVNLENSNKLKDELDDLNKIADSVRIFLETYISANAENNSLDVDLVEEKTRDVEVESKDEKSIVLR